jgi:hypothetical protein
MARDQYVRQHVNYMLTEQRYGEVERILERILHREGEEIPVIAHQGGFRKQWTREEILQAAHDWKEEHGTPPRSADWKFHRVPADKYPHPTTVVSHFGSFAEMMKEAGFEVLPLVMARPTTLMCAKCKEWKVDDAFATSHRPSNVNKRRGRIYTCRECNNAPRRVTVKATGAKVRMRRVSESASIQPHE